MSLLLSIVLWVIGIAFAVSTLLFAALLIVAWADLKRTERKDDKDRN